MTSLVKRENVALQVQTEYAYRPTPRITTTISREGQVVHKVERSLSRPIQSLEEQSKVEITLRRQHSEIIGLIRKSPTALMAAPVAEQPPEPQPLVVQLGAVPGVYRIYTLDNQGHFVGGGANEEFRRAFAAVFKNLTDLLDIFERLPGVGFTRRRGVYEVLRDRLYLISAGLECHFVVIGQGRAGSTDYEKTFKDILDPQPW